MIYLIEFPGYEEKPPFEEAYQQATIKRDWRTVGTLQKAEGMHWYPLWYARGRNHREEKGMIVCEVKEPVKKWFIKN